MCTISECVVFAFSREPRTSSPQDDDVIGDQEDVLQVVADDEDGNAAFLQGTDELEHLALFLDTERGGRLVHDHQLPAVVDGSSDRHRLPLAAL